MNDMALAAGLRQVIRGLSDVVAELEGNVPGEDRDDRMATILRAFDVPADAGLSREQASRVFRDNGSHPRSFGGWVRRGLVARDGDRRYLTDDGRAMLSRLAERTS